MTSIVRQQELTFPRVGAAQNVLAKNYGIVVIIFDILALTLAYYSTLLLPLISSWAGLEIYTGVSSIKRQYYYLALSVVLLLSFAHKGHYNRRVPWWGQVQFIIKAAAMMFLLDGFTQFTLKMHYTRSQVFANWIFALTFLIICRHIAFLVVRQMKGWWLPVTVLGDAQTITDTLYAFVADGHTGYRVDTVLLRDPKGEEIDFGLLPEKYNSVQVIPTLIGQESYLDYIHKNPDFFYIISIDGFRGETRDNLIGALEESGVSYAIIPTIKRLHLHGMEPHYFFGNDLMLLRKRSTIHMNLSRVLKRSMDVAVSSLALLPVALVIPFIYAAKKIEGSKAPLFYGGTRVGKDGKIFPCWKFCTMLPGSDDRLHALLESDPAAREEWERFRKLKNDPRIDSTVSALLRKTSLDELPQLWNIFRGDMSLVGPRPLLENERQAYGAATFRKYTSVRPGLTGLWQVSGRNDVSFQRRVHWDDWYFRNWSLWHDIVILFKTVQVLAFRTGAY